MDRPRAPARKPALFFLGSCNTGQGVVVQWRNTDENHHCMTHITRSGRSMRRTPRHTFDLQPGPRSSSIRNILSYSRSLKVEKHPVVGNIELVLN